MRAALRALAPDADGGEALEAFASTFAAHPVLRVMRQLAAEGVPLSRHAQRLVELLASTRPASDEEEPAPARSRGPPRGAAHAVPGRGHRPVQPGGSPGAPGAVHAGLADAHAGRAGQSREPRRAGGLADRGRRGPSGHRDVPRPPRSPRRRQERGRPRPPRAGGRGRRGPGRPRDGRRRGRGHGAPGRRRDGARGDAGGGARPPGPPGRGRRRCPCSPRRWGRPGRRPPPRCA